MLFAAALAARDLAVLAGRGPIRVPASQLGLGIWAGLTAILAGAMEMSASRRGGPSGRRLIAAALMVASGAALLLYQTSAHSSPHPAGIVSGMLILIAGVLLAVLRSVERPVPALHLLWPAAMLAGALAYRSPSPDALTDARRELSMVLAALQREGANVIAVNTPPDAPRFVREDQCGRSASIATRSRFTSWRTMRICVRKCTCSPAPRYRHRLRASRIYITHRTSSWSASPPIQASSASLNGSCTTSADLAACARSS